MLETRWKLDSVAGKGFNQRGDSAQLTIPGLAEKLNEIDYLRGISHLENIIYHFIKQNKGMTNVELYTFTLKNEFLPKHTNAALENLIAEKKIREVNKSDGYNISYTNYKENRIISKFEVL